MTPWLAPTYPDVETAGWSSSPNQRGTFDIIWTCLQTIALCAWSSICVNVPAPQYGALAMLRDKFHFVLLTLLGPELVFLLAFTQFQSARASMLQFRTDGYPDWTLTHAFYADMGAIHVRDPTWKSFPVNAMQLHYLVIRGYLPYPKIELKEIKARGKADKLGRAITIGQSLYFLVSTLARITQGLCITTLELTVLGFIFPSLATSACWWYKPHDIDYGHILDLSVPVEEILREAGDDGNKIYRNTPLDFVAPEEWSGSNLWGYYVNILRKTRLFPAIHKSRPVQRIPSLNFPRPQSRYSALVVLCLGIAYCSIFFGAWDFYFPTRLEQLLWRVFCGSQCGFCFFAGSFEIAQLDNPSSSHSERQGESEYVDFTSKYKGEDTSTPARSWSCYSAFCRIWNMPCNNSPDHDRRLDVPLKSLVITTPLCAAYCVCRWFLLLEDLVSLRSLPSSAYVTPNWTRYLPWL